MHRPFVVIGLGFGDESKGSIVDALVRKFDSTLVIRHNGGAQAAHTVVTSDGQTHTFSSFGSGTFAGAKTLLSRFFLFDPLALENEEKELQKIDVTDAYDHLYVDERALVVTPFHRLHNQLLEKMRGAYVHGTCGMGIGAAVAHSLAHPEEAIYVSQLFDASIEDRILQLAARLVPGFRSRSLVRDLVNDYRRIIEKIGVVNARGAEVLMQNESLCFEGAQGVLLDQDYGFHPYTTWSKTTSENALTLLRDTGIETRPAVVGVTRAYATRHGAGPFVTEDVSLDDILPEPHNSDIGHQGKFRRGWLDLCALKYATKATGGIDMLAVTHMDVLEKRKIWLVCHWYDRTPLRDMPGDLDAQEKITRELQQSRPVLFNEASENILSTMRRYLDVPSAIESYGPTAEDKVFH